MHLTLNSKIEDKSLSLTETLECISVPYETFFLFLIGGSSPAILQSIPRRWSLNGAAGTVWAGVNYDPPFIRDETAQDFSWG